MILKIFLTMKQIKYCYVFRNSKKKKIIKNIGISIYSPDELDRIWKVWKPDIVPSTI